MSEPDACGRRSAVKVAAEYVTAPSTRAPAGLMIVTAEVELAPTGVTPRVLTRSLLNDRPRCALSATPLLPLSGTIPVRRGSTSVVNEKTYGIAMGAPATSATLSTVAVYRLSS